MAPITKGIRPRPRVALIGKFDQETVNNFISLFPTTWFADSIDDIIKLVSPAELDLVIYGSNIADPNTLLANNDISTISFSIYGQNIKWFKSNYYVHAVSTASTEQFILSDLPLSFARLREVDLSNVENTKDWLLLNIRSSQPFSKTEFDTISEKIKNSAILSHPYSKLSFAFIFQNEVSKLGIAYLPNPAFRVFPWVALICTEWAKNDSERFPNFGDWTKMQAWMTKQEELLAIQLDTTEAEKQKLIIEFNQKIGLLQEELLKSSIKAKDGMRRLITEQGDELVNEISLCLETLGFVVANMDETKTEGAPKLEDLRIQDINDPEWEAIIEVRGYSKSGGTTDDLSRIARFARHYRDEKGKYPSKLIYIVNGQIDLPPSQRQAPLISSPNDVTEFGEQDGIIIWSLDLFRLLKNIDEADLPTIRKLIKDAKGRFVYKE